MSVLSNRMFSLPFVQYKRQPTYYIWYDLTWFLASVAGIALLMGTGYQAPLADFQWWHLALYPVAQYILILAHAFTHCATHNAFPKPINRLVGEICGGLIIARFASWEIIHRRHHRYTDVPDKDPHPAKPGYWRFVFDTIVNVEKQLQQQYYELHGDTPQTRRYEKIRAVWSFFSGATLMLLVAVLIGWSGFLTVYFPAFVGAALFVIHFNWVGHNAHIKGAKIEPTDLDYGWYWLGNRIFIGIYFHGTHHKKAMLFNPHSWAMKQKAKALAAGQGTQSET